MDFAAIDLGSNSFHMLIARVSGNSLIRLGSQKSILKLGSHVRRAGGIPAGVLDEAVDVVASMVEKARSYPDIRVLAVGTSALREAENGAELVRAVRHRTGVAVEIVSGETEARLVYEGARSALSGLPGRIAVLDIGGGSVEIAFGDAGSCTPIATLPLGFLRLERAHGIGGPTDLPTARRRVAELAREAAAELRRLAPEAWVFSGGTARAFAAVSARLVEGGSRWLGATSVRETAELLTGADSVRLERLSVDPGRRDTIGAGAAVLGALVEHFQADGIYVSPGGLREGIILREVGTLAVEARRRQGSPNRPSRPVAPENRF